MPFRLEELRERQGEHAVLRYIVGLGPAEDGTFVYHVMAVIEHDETNERLDGPFGLSDPMTKEQAEHLHLQLSNALGLTGERTP